MADRLQDRFDPNLDYGNVEYTRRQRFLSTFLYNLPIGQGRTLLGNANRFTDSLLGGWELAGVLLFQTGPYLAVAAPGADPSGTNFVNIIGAGRADIVSGAPLYPTNQNASQWINSAAFAIPPNNIGRYGNSPVGAIEGPGTEAISVSLFKTFQFTEHARMQLGGAASNLFNHLNLGLPEYVVRHRGVWNHHNHTNSGGRGSPVHPIDRPNYFLNMVTLISCWRCFRPGYSRRRTIHSRSLRKLPPGVTTGRKPSRC